VYAALGGYGGEVRGINAVSGTTELSIRTNGDVHGVALLNGILYVGGHFSGANSFGTYTRYKLAAINVTTATAFVDPSFAPRVDSALGIYEVRSSPTHVYIGGDFTKVGSYSQPHVAQFTE
jgi:hypothetical protein